MGLLSANALMGPLSLLGAGSGVPGPCRGAALGYRHLVPGDKNYLRGPGFVFDFFRAGGTLRDLHGCERKCVNFGSCWKISARLGSYALSRQSSRFSSRFGA